MLFKQLIERKAINKNEYPIFLENSIHYLTIMGSYAYGVNNDDSDNDVYGFCIPPKEYIFPHLNGEIEGFGKKSPRFNCWQKHNIFDNVTKKEYDFNIYNIVDYFNLCMECNPNMIDSLFTDRKCVIYTSKIGEIVKENRKIFLHKGAWHRFKGYGYSQLHKIKSKNPEGSRKELVEKYGYDVKFAYHVVRLMNEVEQILIEHDIDLIKNNEQLKEIRRGEWKIDQIFDYFTHKEKNLEQLYINSTLPPYPDEQKIKQLLLSCLSMVYENVDSMVVNKEKESLAINEIKTILNKYHL